MGVAVVAEVAVEVVEEVVVAGVMVIQRNSIKHYSGCCCRG